MEKLTTQFAQALNLITINGTKQARAIAAHTEVRLLLEASPMLRGWGVDTVLIGSYRRHTGIYLGNDVDVFTKLTKLDTSVSPEEVFQAVCQLLVDHYGQRAHPQARSVRIDFADDGFHVDVVPAVRSGQRWAIPSRDRVTWHAESSRWRETDPERLTGLTERCNKQPTVDGDGAYVNVVKFVRQAREHHLGDAKPGGLYVELAAYAAFAAGLAGDSYAELLAGTLRSIATLLASGQPVTDPAMGTPYEPQPSPEERAAAAALFQRLAAEAAAALVADRCKAAVHWRGILGGNDRANPVFPLPPGCDANGLPIPAVAPVAARQTNEARGFG